MNRVAGALWNAVTQRDGGCIAPLLDPSAGPCRSRWGHIYPRTLSGILTVDHVRDEPGSVRVSDLARLATICWHHHVHSDWASANRPLLRIYLRIVNSGVRPDLAAAEARAEWSSDPRRSVMGTSRTSATGTTGPSSDGG